MKTSYNDRGEEITECVWEGEDTGAGTGADPDEAVGAADTAADTASAGASKSSTALKEAGAGTGKVGDGSTKKPSIKKASSAAGAKGSAKVSGSPVLPANLGQLPGKASFLSLCHRELIP